MIDTMDDLGNKVIFTYKKLKEKAIQHPELNKKTFLQNVEETIKKPEEVWPDKSDPNIKYCYYKKYSTYSYAKVVIWTKSNPFAVITAYEINHIKEKNYPELNKIR